MRYLSKITAPMIALFILNIVSILPSLGMDSEYKDHPPRNDLSRQVLANMLIDTKFVQDVSDKALILDHAFKFLDMDSHPEIIRLIAKFYCQLKINVKIHNTSYVCTNKDLIQAIDKKEKYIVVRLDSLHIGDGGHRNKEKLQSRLNHHEIRIEEVFIIDYKEDIITFKKDEYGIIMKAGARNSMDFLFKNFPIKTVKLDSSISSSRFCPKVPNVQKAFMEETDITDIILDVNTQNSLYAEISLKPRPKFQEEKLGWSSSLFL